MEATVQGRAIGHYKDIEIRETGLAVPHAEPLYIPVAANGYRTYDYLVGGNLELYIPFYLLKGSTFKSVDRRRLTLTVVGAAWRPNGRHFDGVDDDITVTITLTPPYTVQIWAKCDRLPSVRGLGGTVMDGAVVNEAAMSITTTDRIYYYNGSGVLYASPDPTLTSWHLYTVVVNGANSSFAVDDGTPATGTMAATSTASLRFGENGNNTVWIEGLEGEAIIYSRDLLAVEVKHNYYVTAGRYQ